MRLLHVGLQGLLLRFGLGAAVVAATATQLGCTVEWGGESSEQSIASSSLPIQDGVPVGVGEYAAVGTLILRPTGAPEEHCTAALIGPDLILTAAHCATRVSRGALGQCRAKLTSNSVFIASDGTEYALDLSNARAYVQGQSFEQLTSDTPEFTAPDPYDPYLCGAGAHGAAYYARRPWRDMAVLGLESPVSGIVPHEVIDPFIPVGDYLGRSFEWVGRRGGVTSKYPGSGLAHTAWSWQPCPSWGVTLAPDRSEMFVKELPCELATCLVCTRAATRAVL